MNQEQEVVLITGAAGGLGPAVARAFAASGASLALCDLNAQGLIKLGQELEAGATRCLLRPTDLTRADDAKALCAEVAAAFGRIDAAVHLTGGFRASPVHETSEENWDFLFNVNTRSAYNLAAGVVPIMVKQRHGSILYVGSRAALAGPAGIGVYAAAKAALVRIAESMAAELLESGVRVNCVLPSTIDTPANRRAMPQADPGKWVSPESLAKVLRFLASPAARDISGAAIPVYGRS